MIQGKININCLGSTYHPCRMTSGEMKLSIIEEKQVYLAICQLLYRIVNERNQANM